MKTVNELMNYMNEHKGEKVKTLWKDDEGNIVEEKLREIAGANSVNLIFKIGEERSYLGKPKRADVEFFDKGFEVKNTVLGGTIRYEFCSEC